MIYQPETWDEFRSVGKLTGRFLSELEGRIIPEISTETINQWTKQFADENELICAPYGYRGFPAYVCTSVNHVCCHGIPSEKKILKDGDIVKVDVTFINKNGFYADSCRTYEVGYISEKHKDLIHVAKTALHYGISSVEPGSRVGDIGNSIFYYMRGKPFSVVDEYVGHGIGTRFHEEPSIPHICLTEQIQHTPVLRIGEVFTIEPIINAGREQVKTLKDGWSVVTVDRSYSAQFEHTILLTEKGAEILTSYDK